MNKLEAMGRKASVSRATIDEAVRAEYKRHNIDITHINCAKRAGCSVGHIYNTYGTKEQLVAWCKRQITGEDEPTESTEAVAPIASTPRPPARPAPREVPRTQPVAPTQPADDRPVNPLLGLSLTEQLDYLTSVVLPADIWFHQRFQSKTSSENLKRTTDMICGLRKTLGLSLEKIEPPKPVEDNGIKVSTYEVQLPALKPIEDDNVVPLAATK